MDEPNTDYSVSASTIAYYDFSTSSGQSVIDLSNNSNNLTITGNPSWNSEVSSINDSLVWSTGETTATITVTPTETTEYWLDITTNGTTCRGHVTINVNPASPVPTGDSEQNFCGAATVSDLQVTGENIQWYDAETGGNLLDPAASLADGQVIYASQTIDGCESNERLTVTVSIQDVDITASLTEICEGESVDLSIELSTNYFTNWANGEPNNLALGTEHFGMFLSTGRWNDGPDNYTAANCIVESEVDIGTVDNFMFLGVFENHYYYVLNGYDSWTNCNSLAQSLGGYLAIINSQIETNFIVSNLPVSYDRGWIGMYQDTSDPNYSEPGGGWKWIDGSDVNMDDSLAPPSLTWSTGETTGSITVNPSETTEYWVDVTTNGFTCREYITITVNEIASPTGDSSQSFCDSATVSDLQATGENIQWYDAATAGNLLASTASLNDGQVVYASQTIDGCEGTSRLAVTVSLQVNELTASATEICAGESVDLSVNVSGDNSNSDSCSIPGNLDNGLVLYLPFCNNSQDATTNSNNGIVSNASLTEDRFGNSDQAYQFSESNESMITVNPSTSLKGLMASIIFCLSI